MWEAMCQEINVKHYFYINKKCVFYNDVHVYTWFIVIVWHSRIFVIVVKTPIILCFWPVWSKNRHVRRSSSLWHVHLNLDPLRQIVSYDTVTVKVAFYGQIVWTVGLHYHVWAYSNYLLKLKACPEEGCLGISLY